MIQWVLIVVALITLYAAFWGAFLLRTLFATEGQLIVASEGTELRVPQGVVVVNRGSAQAVGVGQAGVVLLAVWYAGLAVLALAGIWLLASPCHPPRGGA